MPIRKTDPDLEYVTREYVKGKPITRTVAEWRESDRRIAEITKWNEDITELCKNLQTELRAKYETESISIIPDRYKKLQENQGGFDKFVPRNYLSYEVVRVENGTEKLNYYFGRFSSTEDLVETLKQDIYVKRKAEKNSESGSNDTDGDGGGFRERRFPRNTDEGSESNDVVQN